MCNLPSPLLLSNRWRKELLPAFCFLFGILLQTVCTILHKSFIHHLLLRTFVHVTVYNHLYLHEEATRQNGKEKKKRAWTLAYWGFSYQVVRLIEEFGLMHEKFHLWNLIDACASLYSQIHQQTTALQQSFNFFHAVFQLVWKSGPSALELDAVLCNYYAEHIHVCVVHFRDTR